MSPPAAIAIEEAFADEWGRIVAALIRRTRDWDLAEDCARQAFAEAARRWPGEGVPRQPGAWLMTVARSRAIDRLRHERMRDARLREAAALIDGRSAGEEEEERCDNSGIEDDRLRLIFTCCHPALALESRVGLTLRALAGLTTTEIANAFFVPEPTMAKRLVRAKHKIEHAGIPFRVPPEHLLPERTSGVLAVLYLMFNEGYAASTGDELVRVDVCVEAIRLAGLLNRLMPDEPESAGLLALLLFLHSRSEARTNRLGDLITLEEQDRSRWNRAEIDRGKRDPERDHSQERRRALPVAGSQRTRSSSSTTPSPPGWQPTPRVASRSLAGSQRPVCCATTTSCTRPARTSSAG